MAAAGGPVARRESTAVAPPRVNSAAGPRRFLRHLFLESAASLGHGAAPRVGEGE
jgi:hypothetical protein